MNARTSLSALGVGAATFLAVGAAVTLALDANTTYSSLVGVPAGLLVGVGAGVFAYVALARGVTARFRRSLLSTAGGGYAAVGVLVLWNLSPSVRSAVSVREVGVVAAAALAVAYVALVVRDR
ncbi:hypothetical protein [Natronoarchaeum rubrum]|uniref:hypothetical protein n=1 Tax=Natronoarchaeum rubrum TaxID=755311 RepID=UPI002112D3B3|nr:hypothetical protein [Natronoarchaeum rubrum]HMB51259.1 hypothetical protein [Natronoarchaeum rubrum]